MSIVFGERTHINSTLTENPPNNLQAEPASYGFLDVHCWTGGKHRIEAVYDLVCRLEEETEPACPLREPHNNPAMTNADCLGIW